MLGLIELVQIIGSVIFLFLPGLSLSFGLFPMKGEIDWIERIALGFGLSIAIVPIIMFLLNFLIGIKINLMSVSAIIVSLSLGGYALYLNRKQKTKYIK